MKSSTKNDDEVVKVIPSRAGSGIVLVCEHASPEIPSEFNDLGLSPADRYSHVVWDPGARAVAERLANSLGAALVTGEISRLVYDCNRPPNAPDAIPARSETIDVPGNAGLDAMARQARIARYYLPFCNALAQQITQNDTYAVVTIHSFTPVYHGIKRLGEIGVLHDRDTRLADVMLASASQMISLKAERNMPYGPKDGVTHTLKEHAIRAGLLNVMLEIRNDLIASDTQQDDVAQQLAPWITTAVKQAQKAAQNA